MSRKVREILSMLNMLELTTHEDRIEIDRRIEEEAGMNCDEAIENNIISEKRVKEIAMEVIQARIKKKKKLLEQEAEFAEPPA